MHDRCEYWKAEKYCKNTKKYPYLLEVCAFSCKACFRCTTEAPSTTTASSTTTIPCRKGEFYINNKMIVRHLMFYSA